MSIQSALKSQYHAALQTLRQAVEKCPEALWDDVGTHPVPFWRVAYHTLFFAHFYLQKNSRAFTPWHRHRKGADNLGGGKRRPKACPAYSREEILEYWRLCDGMVDEKIEAMDLSAAKCGFWWYPMSKLEHQIVNIRHIQHHAAILSHRLRTEAATAVEWIGAG
jgi:hypothetical protein